MALPDRWLAYGCYGLKQQNIRFVEMQVRPLLCVIISQLPQVIVFCWDSLTMSLHKNKKNRTSSSSRFGRSLLSYI